MSRRRRRRLGPRQLNWLAITLILLSGLLAGFVGFTRGGDASSTSLGTAAFLRFVALLLLVAGTILSVRSVDILILFDEGDARRRALIQLLIGLVGSLLSCVLLATDRGTEASRILTGVGQGILFAGVGLFLAGLVGSLWAYGASYAANRIEKLNEEDW
jgi:drug/metabolite transporter (DMT)-like permease